MRLPPLVAAFLASAAAGPAAAAATDWQELAQDTRVRLIAGETRTPAGTTFIAIELDMPQGMKTYWRVPGETGIATQLDFSGSSGIAGSRFHWPYPAIEATSSYTDFVYRGPVVIPVELTVDGPSPRIDVSLFMGICSDICVPASATFELPLNLEKPDAGNALRIDQALALAPIAWDQPAPAIGALTYDTAGEQLRIELDPAIVDPASVLVDATGAGYLFGAPQKSREPGLVTLPLLADGDASSFGAGPVTVVFMTRDGAYEVERPVAASTPASQ